MNAAQEGVEADGSRGSVEQSKGGGGGGLKLNLRRLKSKPGGRRRRAKQDTKRVSL